MRLWLREHLPWTLARFVPKATRCHRSHETYCDERGMIGCYHCKKRW